LAAKAGIQQLIPLFLQIIQQPQLMEYQHQIGQTINFSTIMDLMMQVSELMNQPDIFVPMTDAQKAAMAQNNPGAQKVQGALAVEQARGQSKQAEIQTQGEVDMAKEAAKIGMEHVAEQHGKQSELELAEGRVNRGVDEGELRGGLPDMLAQ